MAVPRFDARTITAVVTRVGQPLLTLTVLIWHKRRTSGSANDP